MTGKSELNIDLVLDILHGLLFRGGNAPLGVTNVPVKRVTTSGICFVPEAWRVPGNYADQNPLVGGPCFVWCQVQPHQEKPHLRVKMGNLGAAPPPELRASFDAAALPAGNGPLELQGHDAVGEGDWPVYYAAELGLRRDDYTVEERYAQALHDAIVRVLTVEAFEPISKAVAALLQDRVSGHK